MNHTDSFPVATGGAHRGFSPRPQGDARKPMAHVLTAIVSVLLSLGLAHYSGLAKGPQGSPGVTSVVNHFQQAGVCTYFGKDSKGVTRLQVFTPNQDSAGPWCPKGSYISVVPKK